MKSDVKVAAGGSVETVKHSPKFLGVVHVDSGQIVIGDPAYFVGAKFESEYVDEGQVGIHSLGCGVVCRNGDGSFPVFIERDEHGAPRRLVVELVGLPYPETIEEMAIEGTNAICPEYSFVDGIDVCARCGILVPVICGVPFCNSCKQEQIALLAAESALESGDKMKYDRLTKLIMRGQKFVRMMRQYRDSR